MHPNMHSTLLKSISIGAVPKTVSLTKQSSVSTPTQVLHSCLHASTKPLLGQGGTAAHHICWACRLCGPLLALPLHAMLGMAVWTAGWSSASDCTSMTAAPSTG